MFQCQIGTGKVSRGYKGWLVSNKFQCQIGTGKVFRGFIVILRRQHVSMPNWYG